MSDIGIVTTGPNQALIVSGRGNKPRVIVGGRTLVIPVLERLQRISLEVKTLNVKAQNVYTSKGVPVSVDGVAQIKVNDTEESIRLASQNFLSKTEEEIDDVALQSMEGQLRAILGTMTVEEIYKDRGAFADRVKEVAETDLSGMGLKVISFTIREITDPKGYLDALGVTRTAEVKRDAEIGQAEADRDSLIKSSEADKAGKGARFSADTDIAKSKRDFEVEKASFDMEVNARQTEAQLASDLQEAKTKQKIEAEQVGITLARTTEEIKVQDKEVERRRKEQEASVRVPAEAERFRVEQEAQAERAKIVAKGEAEAAAILAIGKAEAEAMELKASAWNKYGDAAIIQMVVDKLPEVAHEIASSFNNVDRIVIIGGGGNNDGIGSFVGGITGMMAQLPAIVESLTGVDLKERVVNKAFGADVKRLPEEVEEEVEETLKSSLEETAKPSEEG